MIPSRRRRATFFEVSALVLLVLVLLLWIRSSFAADAITFGHFKPSRFRTGGIGILQGHLSADYFDVTRSVSQESIESSQRLANLNGLHPNLAPPRPYLPGPGYYTDPNLLRRSGFDWNYKREHRANGEDFSQFSVAVPFWALALALVCGTLPWLRRAMRQRRRRKLGLCLHCGYDLRQSPDRCPECGHASPSGLGVSPERSSAAPDARIANLAKNPKET